MIYHQIRAVYQCNCSNARMFCLWFCLGLLTWHALSDMSNRPSYPISWVAFGAVLRFHELHKSCKTAGFGLNKTCLFRTQTTHLICFIQPNHLIFFSVLPRTVHPYPDPLSIEGMLDRGTLILSQEAYFRNSNIWQHNFRMFVFRLKCKNTWTIAKICWIKEFHGIPSTQK